MLSLNHLTGRKFTHFLPTAVVIAVLFSTTSLPLLAEEVPIESRPTITVSGQGEAQQVPDTAYVSVGVQTQAPQAGEAMRENNRAMEQLLKTFKQRNIQDRDIQTTNFSISPQYQRDRPRANEPIEPKIVGYRVSNQVRVKVRDLDILGQLLDEVVVSGANSISGISFDVAEPQRAEDEARQAAVQDAARRAKLFAEAVGGKVGKPLQISEVGFRPSPRPQMMRAMAAESSVPIARGEQQLTASVTIVYELLTE